MPAITRSVHEALRFGLHQERQHSLSTIPTTAIPPQKKPQHKQTKKAITFAPRVAVRFIPKVSTQRRQNIWYSPEEMREIRKECSLTLLCLESESLDYFVEGETPILEVRGLENKTKTGKRKSALVRHKAKLLVLDEQYRQRQEGIRDDSAISQAYLEGSQRAASVAHAQGNYDHLDSLRQ
eukprot:Nitzschia sp. Nitz4//scaffold69_size99277//24333//24875//NITZ4_004624-RA/size99277-processed-gene-0.76-mRNA-1//-1//CDS//3329556688//7687//frame0